MKFPASGRFPGIAEKNMQIFYSLLQVEQKMLAKAPQIVIILLTVYLFSPTGWLTYLVRKHPFNDRRRK